MLHHATHHVTDIYLHVYVYLSVSIATVIPKPFRYLSIYRYLFDHRLSYFVVHRLLPCGCIVPHCAARLGYRHCYYIPKIHRISDYRFGSARIADCFALSTLVVPVSWTASPYQPESITWTPFMTERGAYWYFWHSIMRVIFCTHCRVARSLRKHLLY